MTKRGVPVLRSWAILRRPAAMWLSLMAAYWLEMRSATSAMPAECWILLVRSSGLGSVVLAAAAGLRRRSLLWVADRRNLLLGWP